jgi:endoglucanase
MPDADHALAFWGDVAATFRDDDAVVFEAFNEPYPDDNHDTDAGWLCWRDGCVANQWVKEGEKPAEYQAAGMQSIVTAIRDTGSQHVILLGGLQY